MRQIEDQNKHIDLLEAALDEGVEFSVELQRRVDRIKALEDVYKVVKEDYLPFLRQCNKGKELETIIHVIEGKYPN